MNEKQHIPNMSKVVLAIGSVVMLFWLGFSERPSDTRLRKVNDLLQRNVIGLDDSVIEECVRKQFEWLATAAGVNLPTNVNGLMSRQTLDLVITGPETARWTQCGVGNAIYDPELKAIYMDSTLVDPYGTSILGFDEDEHNEVVPAYTFAADYLSFILAHEIAHHVVHGEKTASFFHYGGLESNSGTRREEEEADAFAVKLLSSTEVHDSRPSMMQARDSISMILDLDSNDEAELSAEERAYGRVLSSMEVMHNELLFSNSPYSPFAFDAAHPRYLERALTTLERSNALTSTSSRFRKSVMLFQARLERFRILSEYSHAEIYFDKPLLRVTTHKDFVRFGTRDIESHTADIYSMPVQEIEAGMKKGWAKPLTPGESIGKRSICPG